MFIGFNAVTFEGIKRSYYTNIKEIVYTRSDERTRKAVIKLTSGDVLYTDEDFADFILKIEEAERCRELKRTGE
jgi:hypothetical protein